MTVDREKIDQLPHHCYIITNKINNKVYIRVTYKNLDERLKEHIKIARCKSEKNKKTINKAIEKHGSENFNIKLLATYDNAKNAFDAEIEYIKQYNSKLCGYNESDGGDRGPLIFSFTEAEIIKILELYIVDQNVKEISKMTGRTTSSIQDITRLRFSKSHNIPKELLNKLQIIKQNSKKKKRITQEIILNIFNDYVLHNLTLAQLRDKYNYTTNTLYGMLTRRTHNQFVIPDELSSLAINKFKSLYTVDINKIPNIFQEFVNIKNISKVGELFELSHNATANILYRNTYKDVIVDEEVEKEVNEIFNNPPFNIQKWKSIDENIGNYVVQDYINTNLTIEKIGIKYNISAGTVGDILRGRTFDLDEQTAEQIKMSDKRYKRNKVTI
jgi:GIY-YIG catalytic domain